MKAGTAKRVLLAAAGWLLFAVGWVGVFLPGLPTTIFWILAAFAFLRVNRRMYERIVAHPRFGGAVRMFVEEGRISRVGKTVSISAMLLGAGLGVLVIPPLWLKVLVGSAALGEAPGSPCCRPPLPAEPGGRPAIRPTRLRKLDLRPAVP